jgi:hypothetical protein
MGEVLGEGFFDHQCGIAVSPHGTPARDIGNKVRSCFI